MCVSFPLSISGPLNDSPASDNKSSIILERLGSRVALSVSHSLSSRFTLSLSLQHVWIVASYFDSIAGSGQPAKQRTGIKILSEMKATRVTETLPDVQFQASIRGTVPDT